MLYLPPNVGHYGTAISKDCMTYSFGYRSYSTRELWDGYGDYCSESVDVPQYYRDPNWAILNDTSELPRESWMQAKAAMQDILNNEQQLKSWFGCFVTQLDQQTEFLLPEPVSDSFESFMQKLTSGTGLTRHPSVRFAYQTQTDPDSITLFINGCEWNTQNVASELIKLVANNRELSIEQLHPWLHQPDNQQFLYGLWTLQWLDERK
jgi:50S ribosomal protein L16 3-hydroxylase